MTRVIVNDASCLIDLRKGGLLEVVCDLQWQHLDDHGVITYDLMPDEVAEAVALREHHRSLSANDCFCLVAARACRGILLTGDALLRRVATEKRVRVHGVLWVIDELIAVGACPTSLLVEALRVWRDDRTVFLPRHEISKRLELLARHSHRSGEES